MEVTAHDLVVALRAWFKKRHGRYLREAKSLRKCKNNPEVLAKFFGARGCKRCPAEHSSLLAPRRDGYYGG